jgi:hypothetical protein
MTRRHAAWMAIVLAAVALVVFAPPGESVVAPSRTELPSRSTDAPGRSTSAHDNGLTILAIRPRERDVLQGANPFPAPPAPVPVRRIEKPTPLPAPDTGPPQAPPLPFQVIGRFADDGREAVFLLYGEQALVARVGDTLTGTYQVESLSAGTLTLLYLPLQVRQTLAITQAP